MSEQGGDHCYTDGDETLRKVYGTIQVGEGVTQRAAGAPHLRWAVALRAMLEGWAKLGMVMGLTV